MKLNPWRLDPEAEYIIENDPEVKALMFQLGVPDLFAEANTAASPCHMFVAFDNHPTHWVVFSLYKGIPDYSPNHGIHKLVGNAAPNGLLFTAHSRSGMSGSQFLNKLRKLASDDSAPPLSQFPVVP